MFRRCLLDGWTKPRVATWCMWRFAVFGRGVVISEKRKSRESFTSLCLSAKNKLGRVTHLKVFKGSVTIGADAEVVEEPLPACTEQSPFPVLSDHLRNRAAALC